MKTDKQIADVLKAMFDSYGYTGKVGMSFFSDYRAQLSEFDPVSVIVSQMRGYPHQHVMDFLLGCPFLWRELRSEGWLEVMRRASPRPDIGSCKEELSEFCDIEFLHRILRVDGLKAFWEDQKIPRADKDTARLYFSRFSRLLCSDAEDLFDMDGDYFVSAREVDEIRNALVREGHFAPLC